MGGTGFIGPHLTQEALGRGWKLTHFNRDKHAEGGVPGVETLIGDRKGKLDALAGRKWDAVIDDTGFIPKYVKMSAELLAPNVGCGFREAERRALAPRRSLEFRNRGGHE